MLAIRDKLAWFMINQICVLNEAVYFEIIGGADKKQPF